jgi:hypothetical protein
MRMKKLIGYDIDDMLDLVRLERRRSRVQFVLPAMGLLTLGLAIGGGAGLMLAPWSGRRLRQAVGGRIDQLRGRIQSDEQRRGPEMVNATSHRG